MVANIAFAAETASLAYARKVQSHRTQHSRTSDNMEQTTTTIHPPHAAQQWANSALVGIDDSCGYTSVGTPRTWANCLWAGAISAIERRAERVSSRCDSEVHSAVRVPILMPAWATTPSRCTITAASNWRSSALRIAATRRLATLTR